MAVLRLGLRVRAQMAAEVGAASSGTLSPAGSVARSQALAAAGQVRPAQALYSVQVLGAPERTMNMLNAQDAERLNQLAVLAGGTDQTAARAAREEARGILNKLMIPQLEVELGAANIAGQQLPRRKAKQRSLAMLQAKRSKTCGALLVAGERARGAQVTPVPGMPRVSSQITYFDDLAQAADEVADQAARGSIIFGDASRFAKPATALRLTV